MDAYERSLERYEVPPIVALWPTHEGFAANESYRIYGISAPVELKASGVVCIDGVGSPNKKEREEGQKEGEYPQDACGLLEQEFHGQIYEDEETPGSYAVSELWRVNMCAVNGKEVNPMKGGSSGGPVVKLNRAVGLQSGKTKEPSCFDFISPIGLAERDLHVNIVTGLQ